MSLITIVDNLLNKVTMYRLVLYVLLILAIISFAGSALNYIPFQIIPLLFSLVVLAVTSFLANIFFAKLLKVPPNTESFAITALILFFLLPPPKNLEEALYIAAATIIAMASKYLLAWRKKHIFNPAAFAVLVTGYTGIASPAWWAGDPFLIPFIAIGGILIVRKIKRFKMTLTFLIATLISQLVIFTFLYEADPLKTISASLTASPLLFFATIMLTEPLTTPPTQKKRIIYALITALLFSYPFSIGPIYSGPELALVLANIFSYASSPKFRLNLKLERAENIAQGIKNYVFSSDTVPQFRAGQYLEWTAPITKTDSRGNRRYFTIASSPTEKNIILGVKHTKNGSEFKKYLSNMKKGDEIIAGELSGEFTLPKDETRKLVWIAGGIGVTPFRSMAKYLLDTNQKRDITLFYSVKHHEEFAYLDIFEKAEKNIGLKNVLIITDKNNLPEKWDGQTGYLTKEMVKQKVPDYNNRLFYLSGPNIMVDAYKNLLKELGVSDTQIVTDYFPGY